MKTFVDFLEKEMSSGKPVLILGFRQRPERAWIQVIHQDCADIEFIDDAFDESTPKGKYTVPFSAIAIEKK